ncbi:MAG: hypothetical protein HUJ31_08000, partial [Pseudomonadales bacterium]|nr:hypothetical protein [Pseudomonadales bacterium]
KRARLLARWVEGARIDPVRISPDLVPNISKALSLQAADGQTEILTVNESIHDHAYELAVLEDNPGAAGSATWSGTGRLVAGTKARLTQVYKAGQHMGVGAGLLLAKHWTYPWSLQAAVPSANNFIRVSGRAGVEFEMNTVVRDGLHGGMYRGERLPFIEIVSGSIRKGDTITIEYGAGADGFILPDEADDHFELPIYARLQADSPLVRVPVSSLAIEPGDPERLRVVVPSVTRTGEAVAIRVRIEDRLGNVARGDFPSLEILRDGIFVGRIPAGQSPVPVFENLQFDTPGLHWIELRSSGGGLSGRSNPVLVVDGDPEYRILWADLHRDTTRSVGIREPDEVERNTLEDIVLAVDHDNYLSSNVWKAIQEEGLVNGFVRSAPLAGGGHQVVLTRSRVTAEDVLRDAFPSLRSLMRGLQPDNTLLMPLAEIPGDFRFPAPAMTRL